MTATIKRDLRIARLETALKELAEYADADWVRARARRALSQTEVTRDLDGRDEVERRS